MRAASISNRKVSRTFGLLPLPLPAAKVAESYRTVFFCILPRLLNALFIIGREPIVEIVDVFTAKNLRGVPRLSLAVLPAERKYYVLRQELSHGQFLVESEPRHGRSAAGMR